MPILNGRNTQKILKQQMYQWFKHLQENLPEYLEEYIMTEFYNQYSPVMYERKFRILKAITASDIVETSNGYTLEIYLDPNAVSYDPSFWTYPDGKTAYKKGDKSSTVFDNIAFGVHGFIEDPCPYQTEGRFWEEFLKSIGHGGVYDMFVGFKKYMSNII